MNKNFLKITTILCSLAAFPTGLLAEEYTSKKGKTVYVGVGTYNDGKSFSVQNDKGTTVEGYKDGAGTSVSISGTQKGTPRGITKEVDTDGDTDTTIKTKSGTEIYDDTIDGTKVVSIRKDGVHEVQVTPDGEGTATYTNAKGDEGTAKKNTDGNTTTLTINSNIGKTTSVTRTTEGNTTTTTITPDNGGDSKYISKTSENGMNKYQTSGGRTRVEKQHNLPKK